MNAIPKLSKVSSIVWRVLGCNPGPMTLQGSNVYVVGTGPRRTLIDAGQDGFPEYISNMAKLLKEEHVTIENIIITHWHRDHIGGLQDLYPILRPENIETPLSIYKFKRLELPDDEIPANYSPIQYLTDNQLIKSVGASLKVVYTPGHTTDHAVLYLEEENSLFSGDCILGEGTAIFEDLYDYMESLEKIKSLNPRVIYPGHGPIVTNPVEVISYYLQHRLEREQQILATVKNSNKPLTPMDIVKIVYTTTPEYLFPAAEVNVGHHLTKLVKDNKLKRVGDTYSSPRNLHFENGKL